MIPFPSLCRSHRSRNTSVLFSLFSFFIVMFFSFNLQAQGPGSLFVDAGPDLQFDCGSAPECFDITATFLETFETNSSNYSVNSIAYNPPFPFDGLANSLNPDIDDAWSIVETLPFDFCFFQNIETEFQVGSNGVIRFDVDPGDTSNGWSFSEDLPNNTNPTLGEANVFTPGHDIDPSQSVSEEIGYEVLGEFPNRVLVVSYFEVPMFSSACNPLLATQMVVFYEFSNVIEIYMQDKPSCPTWNSGNATLGIQNNDGDIAFVPPGRNTSDSPWTANDEAWQIAPAGNPTYDFAWLDAGGNVIGTTATLEVCPVDDITTYTARVTYTNCNGDEVVLTDDLVVTLTNTYTVDIGESRELCDEKNLELTAQLNGADPADATFLWSTGETTQSIIVSTTDEYSVTVDVDGCIEMASATLVFNESPDFDLGPDIATCFDEIIMLDATPSNYDPAEVTYVWSLDGDVLPSETTNTLVVTEIGTYSVTVTFENCSATDSVNVDPRDDLEVSLGDDFKSCVQEPKVLVADTSETGVTYQWFLNGDLIEGEDQATLNFSIDADATGIQIYSVVITKGDCTGEDSVDVELYDVGNCVVSQGLSPNGDGFNDSMDLEFLSDRAGGISQFRIYNRHGIEVFTAVNYVNEWFGQDENGNELPTGTYFYVIDLMEADPVYGMQATGWVYLNKDAN